MAEQPRAFTLSRSLAAEMLAHLRANLPEEACGLVFGREGVAGQVVAVTNDLHSPVRFFMNPQELYQALTYYEDEGLELLAVFHSHPTGPNVPSPTDVAEFAYFGAVTLIWSPVGGAWQMGAFRIEEDGTVHPVEINWTQ